MNKLARNNQSEPGEPGRRTPSPEQPVQQPRDPLPRPMPPEIEPPMRQPDDPLPPDRQAPERNPQNPPVRASRIFLL